MGLYVLSQRNAMSLAAWCMDYELEDILASSAGATILSPYRSTIHKGVDHVIDHLRGVRYRHLPQLTMDDRENQLLLIAMGPCGLRMLEAIPRWRKRFDVVAAYVVDLYPGAVKRLPKHLVQQLDHLFLSYGQMVEPVATKFGIPTSLIPQACDVLAYGGCGGDRPTDVIGYGRRDPDVHRELQRHFCHRESKRFYQYSTFANQEIRNWLEHRQLFWQTLRRSKISLAYSFETTHSSASQGVSPLTVRWFEGVTAGAALVGRRPTGPEADELLGWEDAVIELPASPGEAVDFIESLLNDHDRLGQTSIRNYVHALRLHDWRYRARDMFRTMQIPIPASLTKEISLLSQIADRTERHPLEAAA